MVPARPDLPEPLKTATLTWSRGTSFTGALAGAGAVRRLAKNDGSFASSSRTTDWPPLVALPSVGTVLNWTLPAASPRTWRASCSGSRSLSIFIEVPIASSSRLSLIGLPSTPRLVILRKVAPRKYCWRAIRSRSPLGRPLRWRTNASACLPSITDLPAGRSIPESCSFCALFRQTSTPPIAFVTR